MNRTPSTQRLAYADRQDPIYSRCINSSEVLDGLLWQGPWPTGYFKLERNPRRDIGPEPAFVKGVSGFYSQAPLPHTNLLSLRPNVLQSGIYNP